MLAHDITLRSAQSFRPQGRQHRRHRVALIASSRFPIAEPFAGGLEAHVWHLAAELRQRGHSVTMFAAEGSDVVPGVETMVAPAPVLSSAARADVSMPSDWWMAEHHAYLTLMLALGRQRSSDFDIVHNHSLHHLPVAMAPIVKAPVVTTLHTPPTPWLESAFQARGHRRGETTLVAVSRFTAAAWSHVDDAITVVPNGVDVTRWPMGHGGGPLMWCGRMVPEKGADVAIRAARATGRTLWLAGPVVDRGWFNQAIEPYLGADVSYLGHLDQAALAHRIGQASAMLVTPRWDEPYGLVAAESLACGTPVAGFRRGGVPEIVDSRSGVLVAPHDEAGLPAAVEAAVVLSRTDCRERAETHCSIHSMVDQYEEIYERLVSV